MLYTVTTKTPKKKKESAKSFKHDYHIFIVKADSDKEIKEKFKASWPEHKIVDMMINTSNIIEV
jgi:hypothetical protein